MSENQIWGEMILPREAALKWQSGPLSIWLQKQEGELWLGNKYLPEDQGSVSEMPPEDLKWSRFTIDNPNPQIIFSPIFPNHSLVIKTEYPFWLTMNAQAKIYVRVPIWALLELKSPRIKLAEIPTVILSNTWFGDFATGELCYWISSSARRSIEPDVIRQYLAICPIIFINKTDEDLLVEKFCFRVSGLSLFYDGTQLWSDETRVNYRGSSDISQIEVTGKAPPEAKSAKKISDPRSSDKKSMTRKTFETLIDISGINLL